MRQYDTTSLARDNPWRGRAACSTIVAEIGADMAAFGTAQRIAAWAGVCPVSDQTAGKQKRRGTRKGNIYLKAALVTTAISTAQAKRTYLQDKFYRLKARMGAKKAAMTMAHELLVAAFHMLQRGTVFADLGADHLDRLNSYSTAKSLARRLWATM